MKKVVSVTEVSGEGLEALMGEKVLLLCNSYFYTGILTGVNNDFVLLEKPSIVYETGRWNEVGYKDTQSLHADKWYVQRASIESYGISK